MLPTRPLAHGEQAGQLRPTLAGLRGTEAPLARGTLAWSPDPSCLPPHAYGDCRPRRPENRGQGRGLLIRKHSDSESPDGPRWPHLVDAGRLRNPPAWHWMRRGQAEGRSMAEPRPPRFLHPQCAWPRDPPRCRIRSHSQGAATAEFAAATAIWTRRPPSGSDRSSERCPRRLPRPLARIRGCRLGYPQCRRHEKLAWHAGKPPHRLPVQAQPFDNRPVDLRDGAARVHAQEHVPPVEH